VRPRSHVPSTDTPQFQTALLIDWAESAAATLAPDQTLTSRHDRYDDPLRRPYPKTCQIDRNAQLPVLVPCACAFARRSLVGPRMSARPRTDWAHATWPHRTPDYAAAPGIRQRIANTLDAVLPNQQRLLVAPKLLQFLDPSRCMDRAGPSKRRPSWYAVTLAPGALGCTPLASRSSQKDRCGFLSTSRNANRSKVHDRHAQ
jgi:hypothetical protein